MDKLTTKDLLYEPMKELGMKVLVSFTFIYFHIWLLPRSTHTIVQYPFCLYIITFFYFFVL